MDLIYIILIVSLIVISIPWIYGILLPIFKPKLSGNSSIYLYAFSSGFFIILSIFGFFSEAKEELTFYLEKKKFDPFSIMGINIGIIGGGAFLILSISILIKFLIAKKLSQKEEHSLETEHDHSNLIYNMNDVNLKSKILALILLLSHRIPGGLIIGFLIASIQKKGGEISVINIMFLLTFALHIIPEELVLYYRQIEIGINKWKATLYSFLGTLLLVPFIFIGAYSSESLGKNVIVLSFLKVCVGSIILFSSLVEFIPEFLHKKMDAKSWYITISLMMLGVVFGLILFSIHSHESEDEQVKTSIQNYRDTFHFISLQI